MWVKDQALLSIAYLPSPLVFTTYFALSSLEQSVSVLLTSCTQSACEESRKNEKIIVGNCTNYSPVHGQLA